MNNLIITQLLKEFKNMIEEIMIREKLMEKAIFVNQMVSKNASPYPITIHSHPPISLQLYVF